MLNIKSKETDAFYLLEDDLEANFNNSNFWAREKVWGAVKRIRALKKKKSCGMKME
jgi:hypothetical protein